MHPRLVERRQTRSMKQQQEANRKTSERTKQLSCYFCSNKDDESYDDIAIEIIVRKSCEKCLSKTGSDRGKCCCKSN
jgi:hypothetical protein